MDLCLFDRKAADVDPVEAKHGVFGREAATGSAGLSTRASEYLVQPESLREQRIGFVAPVIEIAGDDQRRILPGDAFQVGGQRIQLPAPRTRKERKVYADAVQGLLPARQVDLAVQ